MIVSDSGGTKFAPHPVGVTPARCIRVIDLGTQDTVFQGKPKQSHKCIVVWESAQLMPDGEMAGKPFLITNRYTANLSEKSNLRKDLESWRGRKFTDEEIKGFDLKNVLGKAALLNIVHDDNGYARIASLMPLPGNMTCPERVNPIVHFDLSNFDKATYDSLSDKMKELIAKSPEYKEVARGIRPDPADGSPASHPIDDGDIPF